MKTAIPHWTLCALALTGVMAACSEAPETLQEAKLEASAAHGQADGEASQPEPSSENSLRITDLIRLWVASAADDKGVYDIPEKADHDVGGMLAAFHTVHQTSEDSYSVCVDFEDGENNYDVDFFVEQTADGLVVVEHYLHQIDGETIQ